MDRAMDMGMNGVVFAQDAYTDLDFADDISLLAELPSLLIPGGSGPSSATAHT